MLCHQLFFPLWLICTCKRLSILQKRLTSTIFPFHSWIWKSLRASLFKHPEPRIFRGKCCIPRSVFFFLAPSLLWRWCPGGTSSIMHGCAPWQALFSLHRGTCPKHPPQWRKRGRTAQNQFSDGISFSFLVGMSSSCNLEEMHTTKRRNVEI